MQRKRSEGGRWRKRRKRKIRSEEIVAEYTGQSRIKDGVGLHGRDFIYRFHSLPSEEERKKERGKKERTVRDYRRRGSSNLWIRKKKL